MSDIDCLKWQQQQLKALSYIYLDEFHSVRQSSPHKFMILCKPFGSNELQYQLNIIFEFTKSYPKTPIKYEFQSVAGITRDNIKKITQKVQEIIVQNMSRPIVYDIVEETRNWICEYLVSGKSFEQDEIVIKKVQEVYERPKFETYTPVTVQSFMAWKRQFDEKHKKLKVQKKEDKPTGKQWFLGKKDLEQSDQEDQDDQQGQQDQQQPTVIPTEQNNDLF